MMKRMKFSFLMILVVPTILWLLADTLYPEPFTYFAFRKVFIQYSGGLLKVQNGWLVGVG